MPFLGLGNYAKPGPGVRKDEEEKSVWLKFFIIFKRRFSKFMQLNLTFMLPLIGVVLLMLTIFFVMRTEWYLPIGDTVYMMRPWELYAVPLPLILLSPFWGGVMVVAKRLAKQEYVFVWSEFWRGVKDNWKQFLLNGLFVYGMYVLLSFAFLFYSANLSGGFLYYVPYALIILVTVLLVFSQYYVSVMIVSVNLKLSHIYKNALIFAVLGLGRNLLFTLVIGGLLAFVLWPAFTNELLILVTFIFAIFIVFAFVAYTNAYLAYPLIQSYIINPYENKDIIKQDPQMQPSTENFAYARDELDEEQEKAPRYVYVDGKLVRQELDEGGEEEQIFTDQA